MKAEIENSSLDIANSMNGENLNEITYVTLGTTKPVLKEGRYICRQ